MTLEPVAETNLTAALLSALASWWTGTSGDDCLAGFQIDTSDFAVSHILLRDNGKGSYWVAKSIFSRASQKHVLIQRIAVSTPFNPFPHSVLILRVVALNERDDVKLHLSSKAWRNASWVLRQPFDWSKKEKRASVPRPSVSVPPSGC